MQRQAETYELQYTCINSFGDAANHSAFFSALSVLHDTTRRLLFTCYGRLVHEGLYSAMLFSPPDRTHESEPRSFCQDIDIWVCIPHCCIRLQTETQESETSCPRREYDISTNTEPSPSLGIIWRNTRSIFEIPTNFVQSTAGLLCIIVSKGKEMTPSQSSQTTFAPSPCFPPHPHLRTSIRNILDKIRRRIRPIIHSLKLVILQHISQHDL